MYNHVSFKKLMVAFTFWFFCGEFPHKIIAIVFLITSNSLTVGKSTSFIQLLKLKNMAIDPLFELCGII